MSNKEAVANVLAGRKTPLTSREIAERTGASLDTTRRYLGVLVEEGAVVIDGYEHTGKRGRPSPLYRAAA